MRPCAAAWSLDGPSACAESESSSRREVESAAAPEEKDANGKQEFEGRDIGVAGTGLSFATGDAATKMGAGERGEATDCTGAEERAEEGRATEAGAGGGEGTAGCCGVGAITRAKNPETAWRALERERDMLSKTREGCRGGVLGCACRLGGGGKRLCVSCKSMRRRREAMGAAAAVGTTGFLRQKFKKEGHTIKEINSSEERKRFRRVG